MVVTSTTNESFWLDQKHFFYMFYNNHTDYYILYYKVFTQ